MNSFAVALYHRFLAGEAIEQIAAALGIPTERVARRIRAAEDYFRRQPKKAA